MNQIINIILRQVFGQLVRRGMNAGFNKAGKMGQRRKQRNMPMGEIDDYGNPVDPHAAQHHDGRQQRQQAQQQRRQMQAARRATKF